MSGGTLSVLIVDDHALLRMGLATAIGEVTGFSVCGQAGTAAEGVELYRTLRPDIVLMDLRLPDASGAWATEAICREFPDAKIIIFSSAAPEEDVYAAISAGARGYVLKTIDADKLIAILRNVAAGLRHIPADIASNLASRLPRPSLSDREQDVLRLLARGKRNRQIADELGITEGTVKTHVVNILLKLGATDRTEAAMIAVERGIVRHD